MHSVHHRGAFLLQALAGSTLAVWGSLVRAKVVTPAVHGAVSWWSGA